LRWLDNEMSPSLQFVLPTSDLHGGIRLPLELAEWLTDGGWTTRAVGPGPPPDWHRNVVPWFTVDFEESTVPRADITIATFYTTIKPALSSNSDHVFHLCQGYEGQFEEYAEVKETIDDAYGAPIPKLVVSQHLEGLLREHYPECRCHFIGEAVDPRTFFPLGFRREATPLRVGLVGSFSARVKGIREGLEGIRIARERGLEIEVHRASAEPMQTEESALGVTDHFHHRLATAKMPEFYAGIDALLFPSTAQEGFGLPVLEAMSCGIPVIHSDIPSLEVLPSDATLRFAPGESHAIADAVARLRDADLRRFLRGAGLVAADEFRPQGLITRFEDALSKEGCPLP
jgi:glycosyltransferase involved in cell wall biosynthesis